MPSFYAARTQQAVLRCRLVGVLRIKVSESPRRCDSRPESRATDRIRREGPSGDCIHHTLCLVSTQQAVLPGELECVFKEMMIKVSESPRSPHEDATRAPNAAQQTKSVAKGLRASVFIVCA